MNSRACLHRPSSQLIVVNTGQLHSRRIPRSLYRQPLNRRIQIVEQCPITTRCEPYSAPRRTKPPSLPALSEPPYADSSPDTAPYGPAAASPNLPHTYPPPTTRRPHTPPVLTDELNQLYINISLAAYINIASPHVEQQKPSKKKWRPKSPLQ